MYAPRHRKSLRSPDRGDRYLWQIERDMRQPWNAAAELKEENSRNGRRCPSTLVAKDPEEEHIAEKMAGRYEGTCW